MRPEPFFGTPSSPAGHRCDRGRTRRGIAAAVCVGLLTCVPVTSRALELQPGLWEFQVTMQGGMMGNQVMSQQQCIEEAAIDPGAFTTGMGPCRIGDIDESASNFAWTFSCDMQGMTTSGSGSMFIAGDTVRGSVRLTMAMPASAGGQQFTLDNTWAGRRVGECF